MNTYIQGRVLQFEQYFESLEEKRQNDALRSYVGNIVGDILGVVSGRKYCEMLAGFLIESGQVRIGVYTFDSLVLEIETFFEKRKEQIYHHWQKKVLDWLDKKSKTT